MLIDSCTEHHWPAVDAVDAGDAVDAVDGLHNVFNSEGMSINAKVKGHDPNPSQ